MEDKNDLPTLLFKMQHRFNHLQTQLVLAPSHVATDVHSSSEEFMRRAS